MAAFMLTAMLLKCILSNILYLQVKLSFFLCFSFFLTYNHESRFGLLRAPPSQHTSAGDGGSSPLLPMIPLPPPSFPRAGVWASGEQSSTCISCNLVSKICQVMESELSQRDLGGDQKLEEMLHLQPRRSLARRPQLLPSLPSTRAMGQLLCGGWEEQEHSFSNQPPLSHLAWRKNSRLQTAARKSRVGRSQPHHPQQGHAPGWERAALPKMPACCTSQCAGAGREKTARGCPHVCHPEVQHSNVSLEA